LPRYNAATQPAPVGVPIGPHRSAPSPDIGFVSAASLTPQGGSTVRGTGKLTHAGMSSSQAADLATLMIAVLEGSHILCRAAGSIAPFDRAAAFLLSALPSPG
jgi:hypothetical protein